MTKKILRLPDVIEKTGLSRSTIYLRMSCDSFPAAVPLGGRAVGWLENELEVWIDEQVNLSRAEPQSGGAK